MDIKLCALQAGSLMRGRSGGQTPLWGNLTVSTCLSSPEARLAPTAVFLTLGVAVPEAPQVEHHRPQGLQPPCSFSSRTSAQASQSNSLHCRGCGTNVLGGPRALSYLHRSFCLNPPSLLCSSARCHRKTGRQGSLEMLHFAHWPHSPWMVP